MRKICFILLCLMVNLGTISAQTLWLGIIDSDWNNPINWSAGLPSQGSTATILSSPNDPIVNSYLVIDFTLENFANIIFDAEIYNNGAVINFSGSDMQLATGSKFVNSGSVTLDNQGSMSNFGDFDNYGTLNHTSVSIFNNESSGTFRNYNIVNNFGDINNNGLFENYGSLTNDKIINNNASFQNYGTMTNTFVSTFFNGVSGNLTNNYNSTLIINNILNNNGIVTDSGTTILNGNASVENNNTIEVDGFFQQSGIVNNNNTIIINEGSIYKVNIGSLFNGSSIVNNGTIDNVGTLDNLESGNLNNNGTLTISSCHSMIQRSTNVINNVTNEGVIYDLTNAVIVTNGGGNVEDKLTDIPVPTVTCQDITIQVDGDGEVTISDGAVIVEADASYCNIVTVAISKSIFTCNDLGVNTVDYTITDGFNNSTTCTSTVTVIDASPLFCPAPGTDYCEAGSQNSNNEFIASVEVSGVSNLSGNNGGYGDFTDQIVSLEVGQFYPITLTPGFNGESSLENWLVLVDWNSDGDFNDLGELITLASSTGVVTAQLNVPNTAITGTTRMRIAMSPEQGNLTPCPNYAAGEVEDYTIKIESEIFVQYCGLDITTSTLPGGTTANVNWISPSAFSTCPAGVEITQIAGPTSGSSFGLGTTTITYQFSDECGSTTSCSFDVTVNQTPVTLDINCPFNTVFPATPGLGGAIVNWVLPFPLANCPSGVNPVTQVSGPVPGDFLNIGVQTVTLSVTDNCGNTATCSFQVFVEDPAESLTINCLNDIVVNTAPGAFDAVATWSTPTTTSSCAANNVVINQVLGSPSGSSFPIGATTITYLASDDCFSAETCSFNIIVEPTEETFEVVCPTTIVANTPPGGLTATVSWTEPAITSNCALGEAVVTQTTGGANGSEFPVGITVITYEITDGCGNLDICTFAVSVSATPATLTFTCPSDITVNGQAGESFGVAIYEDPVATSDCQSGSTSFSLFTGVPSGGEFPIGVNTVTYLALDGCGNTANCSFTVTVIEFNPILTIACDNDITLTAGNGECAVAANWNVATATSNCPAGVTNLIQTAGPANGSNIDVGVYTVTYGASDDCNNVESCSFTVTVLPTTIDDADIDMNCPVNIVANLSGGATTFNATWSDPTATTNCDPDPQPNDCTSVPNTISGWVYMGEFNGSKYYCSNHNKSWDQAQAAVSLAGGHVVVINDAQENEYIRSNIMASEAWIGYTDEASEGNFDWVNGDPDTYTKWNTGEPNNTGPDGTSNADYTVMRKSDGKWRDRDGCNHYEVVMEIPCGGFQAPTCPPATAVSSFIYMGEYNGSRYYCSSSGSLTWWESKALCEQKGGHLAIIDDIGENNFIHNFLLASSAWIGYTDHQQEGNWNWVANGSGFTNWQAGEPNNSNGVEHYARIKKINGQWTDRPNSMQYECIMEIPCSSNSDSDCYPFGTITREKWDVPNGWSVNEIDVNSTPTWTAQLNIFEAPSNQDESFGQRLSGYIFPPTTGNYTFWIASDDHSELWLSTDHTAANVQKIAELSGWAPPRDWTKFPSQKSVQIHLTAGQPYYIEALHVDSHMGDNLAVGWELPDGTLNRPISGAYLSPRTMNCINPGGGNGGNGGGDPGLVVTQICGPASGSEFPVGTTTIIYEAVDNCGNSETCSFDITVNPDPNGPNQRVYFEEPANYCEPSSNSTQYEYINKVVCHDINNTSGNDGGYGDYTDQMCAVPINGTHAITLEPGFNGNAYNEYWKVWVDWNRDGVFDNATETVFTASGNGTVSGNISIPADAEMGRMRMRISMKYGGYATPCQDGFEGEIEDYTLSIYNDGSIAQNTNNLTVALVQEFDAYAHDARTVKLNWLTNTEYKNDFFVLERSSDGREFEAIHEVMSTSENSAVKAYNHVDLDPVNGVNYYRIKYIFNENFGSEYSEIKTVKFDELEDYAIFPNPAKDFFFIDLEKYMDRTVELKIFNEFGHEMMIQNIPANHDKNVKIDVSAYQSGFYTVFIRTDNKKPKARKLIIKKTF